MPKSFSPQEKEQIHAQLVAACSDSWTRRGYKKTSVDDLCAAVGISKGGFYLFFDSKEVLFGEVLCQTQQRIYDEARQRIRENPGKAGVLEALRYIYQEYDWNNFLHNSDSADYAALLHKLSPQMVAQIREGEQQNRDLFLTIPGLRRACSDELTVSVIYSLLMGIKQKDVLPHHRQVFDFLAKQAIEKMYEEDEA